MTYLKQIALGIIAAELILAAVLVVSVFMPLPGKVQFKIVLSGSMEPTVPVGSVVFIAPSAAYATGDIITFGEDTKKRIPVTHRVVAVEREAGAVRYLTKGDANQEADNIPIAHNAVVGRVLLTVPRLGYVFEFARSKNGFITTIVIPAALIVLDELITIYGALRHRRKAKGVSEHHHRALAPEPPVRTREALPVRRTTVTPHTAAAPDRMNQIRAGIDGCRVVLRPQYTS